MADQQVRTEPVEQPEKRQRFTLPSAYTILFALIVLMRSRPGSSRPGSMTGTRRAPPSPGPTTRSTRTRSVS